MKKITALFLAVAVMVLSLSGCGLIFGEKDIELSETSINMIVGDSAVLSVTDESNKPVPKLSWSSSDSSVVTVNDGSLMAKAAGTAVVTVTTEGGISKSCNVTVNDKEITKITLDSQTIKLKAGKTVQLNAKFDPPDATKTNLTWSSSDSTVAMVNSEGFVTGVSKGVVSIYCRADNNIEASCTVTVEAKASNNSSSKSTKKDSGSNTYIYYGRFDTPYLISVDDDSTIIYSSPSFNGEQVQNLPIGTYTIVDEQYDENNNLWGKLKSGIGWICLSDIE